MLGLQQGPNDRTRLVDFVEKLSIMRVHRTSEKDKEVVMFYTSGGGHIAVEFTFDETGALRGVEER